MKRRRLTLIKMDRHAKECLWYIGRLRWYGLKKKKEFKH